MRPGLSWSDTHLPGKRLQRYLDPLLLIEPPVSVFTISTNVHTIRVPDKLPYLQLRLGELVRKQPEARYERRPAPFGRFDAKDVDAERIARLGFGDVHGPIDLVELREDEGFDRCDAGRGRDLAVGRVEAVESDRLPRGYVDDWSNAARRCSRD